MTDQEEESSQDLSQSRSHQYEIPLDDLGEINFLRENEHQEGQDFTQEELFRFKSQLALDNTEAALAILQKNPILRSYSLYRLFCLYFSIAYECRRAYECLIEENSEISCSCRYEKMAWAMIRDYGYDGLTSDAGLKSQFSHFVMYKALDFNMREVFSLAFDLEEQLLLRKQDVEQLLKYKHNKDICKTFQKPILKSNALALFFQSQSIVKEDSNFVEYNLEYYVESMLTLNYGSEVIIEFIQSFPEYLKPGSMVKHFIRNDKLDLVMWMETHPKYQFVVEHYIWAVEADAMDLAFYLNKKYAGIMDKSQSTKTRVIINSFGQSNRYYEIKALLLNQYFKSFNVYDVEQLVAIMTRKLLSTKYCDSPFLYCMNPVKVSLLLYEILHKIKAKFKIFQVQCLKLQEHLESSLLKFVTGLANEEIASFMLLEKDFFGRDSLELLSQFRLYSIIQQRSVNEVIMQIYKSKYSTQSITSWKFQYLRINKIICTDRLNSETDIEKKYSVFSFATDEERRNISQNVYMFNIMKHHIMARYNYELAYFTLVTIIYSTVVNLVFTTQAEARHILPYLELFEVDDPQIYLPENQKQYLHACHVIKENTYVQYNGILVGIGLSIIQLSLGVKLITDLLLRSETSRKINFFTLENIFYGLLTINAVLSLHTFVVQREYQSGKMYEYCYSKLSFTEDEILTSKYLQSLESDQSSLSLYVAAITVIFFGIILLKLRMVPLFGPSVNTIISMFTDFFKIAFFYVTLFIIFLQIGVYLFPERQEFATPQTGGLFLFQTGTGIFSFRVFTDIEDEGYSLFGIAYMIAWLVISNIVYLNLLIAIFSNTYNMMSKDKYGQFLKQIIDMRPYYEYDECYGALVFIPFPTNLLLLPFLPFYKCIRKEEFNEFVCKILYFFTVLLLEIPGACFFLPLKSLWAYVKILLNKGYILLYVRESNRNKWYQFGSLLFFMIFGIFKLLILSVVDQVIIHYLLFKPTENLELKYQREDNELSPLEIDQTIKYLQRYSENSQHSQHHPTKNVITELRQMFKVDEDLREIILVGSATFQQNLAKLRAYSKLKGLLIDSSIRINGQYFIYSQMLTCVIQEIIFSNKIETINERFGQKKFWQSSLNKVLPEKKLQNTSRDLLSSSDSVDKINLDQFEIDGKVRSLKKNILMAQIGNAANSFVVNEKTLQESQINDEVEKNRDWWRLTIQKIRKELDYKLCQKM